MDYIECSNRCGEKSAVISYSFEVRALVWYMGYLDQHATVSIEDIKDALKR